jgi:hypothetical protein
VLIEREGFVVGAKKVRLADPVTPESLGVVGTNRTREQVFCGKEA